MRKNESMKKIFSILICVLMLVQRVPATAFAAGADNLCEHHTEHTADCSYADAAAGSPCTYHCDICLNHDHGEEEAVCTCETDDPAIHAAACAVYVQPENPECSCAEKCEALNQWCDICGFDYTQCGGTDEAAAYAETVTIYFKNTGGWTAVNAFYFGGTSSVYWPGETMTHVGNDIWSLGVPADAVNIIFNYGGTQTTDQNIPTDGKNLYTYNTNDWSVYDGNSVGGEDTTPAEITGVSITVDGTTYTEGNVTITPETQSIIYTVYGTNFANASVDNFLMYDLGSAEPLNSSWWTIDAENNSAIMDLSDYIFWFEGCDNFEVEFSNDRQQSWTSTGIYLTYDDGTTGGEEEDAAASVTIGNKITYHETLDEAIQAVKNCTAADNATVKLLNNLSLTETVIIESGVFTIDLQEKHVTFSEDADNGFEIFGGEVTFAGTGTVKMEYGVAIWTWKYAVVSITGGTYDAMIALVNYTNVTVSGGALKGFQCGIRNVGNLTIAGGEVSSYQKNTTNPYDVAAILAIDGSITVTGGTLKEGRFGMIVFNGGTVDLSRFSEAEGVTIWRDDAPLTEMDASDVKLPDGCGLYDEEGNQQTGSIAPGTMLKVRKLHTHRWTYTAGGNTITAACESTIGTCPDPEQSFTLNAPDAVYSGEMVNAEVTREGMDLTFELHYTGTNYDSADAPINAGDYTVTMTVGDKSVSDTFTISPKNIANCNVSMTEDTFTYSGKAPELIVSVMDNGVGSTQLKEDIDYTVGTAAVNAGSYKLTVTGVGNYTGNVALDYTINAKEVSSPTIILEQYSYAYDGQAKEPAVTVMDGNTEIPENEYTVLYDNNTNAGEADVIIDDDGGNYLVSGCTTFVITKIDPEYSIPTGLTATYGDRLADVGLWGAWAWKDTAALVGNVGTHSFDAIFTPRDITNYNTVTKTLSVEVGAKPVSVTVTASDKTYDGNTTAAVSAVVTTGLLQGDSITISGLTGTFSDANAGENKTVTIDSSNVTVEGTNADCYEITYPTAVTATINKADAIVTKSPEAISGLKFKEENGSGVLQELVTAGEAIGGTMLYRVDGDEWSTTIPTKEQVWGYTVYYKVQGDSNYNDSAEGSVEVSIAKADAPIVDIPLQQHIYTTATTGNSIDFKSFLPKLCGIENDRSRVTGTTGDFIENAAFNDGVLTYDTKPGTLEAIGTITVTVEMRAYEDVTVMVYVKLIDLKPVSNSGSNAEIKYDGSTYDVAQMFTKDTKAGAASYTIVGGTGAGTLNGSVLTITKAGTIQIKMTTAAQGNYAAGEATAILTVNKADGTGTVSMDGWTYGENAKTPTTENGTGTATFLYIGTGYSSADVPTDAGTYTVTATFAENDLYEAATATDTFVIEQKELTPAISGSVSKTYDGTTTVPDGLSITLSGVITGDDVSAAAAYAYESADVGTTKIDAVNITLNGADAGNYKLTNTTASAYSGTITKADSSYEAPTAAALAYNASEQALVSGGSAFGGTLQYSLDNSTWSDTIPTGKNAGSYTVYFKVAGDSNHNDSAGSVAVTISKRDVTVTAKDQTITYGETISGTEFTSAGLLDGHSATVTLTPGTDNVTTNGTITPSAVITADGTDVTANYNISCKSGKLVIEPDTSGIDALTTDNVTSANEEDIKAVQAMMASAETDGIDEATAEQWAAITANCEDLIEKIKAVEAENARIADVAADFDLNTVKSSDEAAIAALIADIDELLATNNLTDEERSELEGLKAKCNNLIAKIDGTEILIDQLDKTVDDLDAETVKSIDKATLEQVIADAQTLIDSGNVTEAEKEALVKTQEDAKALIQVIDDTAAENQSLTDQAAAFDEDAVKSTDKENLEQIVQDIEDLLDTQNLTEDERTALEAVLEQVEGMIDTINETAQDSKTAAETIDALDPATVTSDDVNELEQAIAIIDELLNDDHLTEDERKALEDAKADAEALIDVIEAAQDAADTENTEKVEEVTAENVKPEDKEALEDAKADLEKALEDNAGNYTEEEKKALQDEIQRIEDAIEALENVEDVIDSIIQLPETVEPDDEETAEKILDAKKTYDELTDHEKSLVDETTKKKLDDLAAALTAYDIIMGDGGKWTKGSEDGLSFTANGSFSKFVGIEVDGKEVASAYYTAESGSTIITLKQSFLKRLSTGEHTITVLYTDGETSGTFKILAASSTPATGDNSNIALWFGMLCVSALGLIVLIAGRKRRRSTK